MSSKRTSGHVFVRSSSGLVIPFKPPELDPESAVAREAERAPTYLLTAPGQAYAGSIMRGADGEPELWLEPVDSIGARAAATDAAAWALEHFYYTDRANACMHCAPVRFSPITFRLAELVGDGHTLAAEVLADRGRYELDAGR